MNIIKATKADANAAWQIRTDAILAKCANLYSTDIIEQWTAGDSPTDDFIADVVDNFYVVVMDEKVVGTGKLTTETAMVDAIFVAPDYMGKGIAKAMIKHLAQIATTQGLKQIKLESTLNAAGFYRSCGFVGDKVSVYKSPRGIEIECVPMVKVL